jgi:hypothetical protein
MLGGWRVSVGDVVNESPSDIRGWAVAATDQLINVE